MGETVNASNYFEASEGVFRKLPRRIAALFLSSVGDDVEWAGTIWSFNFKSNSSFYWTNGTHLIRVSDHWSRGNVRCACNWIRRCWWELSDRSRSMKKGCVGYWFGGFYAGMIAFADMRPIC